MRAAPVRGASSVAQAAAGGLWILSDLKSLLKIGTSLASV